MRAQGEDGGGSRVNIAQERRDLLNDLVKVTRVAFEKYENERTKNSERQAWGRLIVNAVSAASGVLRDADLDELAERVAAIEAAAGKVGVEDGEG